MQTQITEITKTAFKNEELESTKTRCHPWFGMNYFALLQSLFLCVS